MNNTFIEEMNEQLEEERVILQEQLDTISTPNRGDHVIGERVPTLPQYDADSDRFDSEMVGAGEVQDYYENVDATGVLTDRLRAVEAAMQRVNTGAYGTCVQCGEQIDEERLRANPAAETCMSCAAERS